MKTGDKSIFVLCGPGNYCKFENCYQFNPELMVALSGIKALSSSSNEH